MPQTTVNTPDGGTVTVNHPEGATEEQILRFAKQQYVAPKEETYAEGVARRYAEADFAGPVEEFVPEFKRRLAKQSMVIPGVPGSGEIGVSDVTGTAVSQAARTAGELAFNAVEPLIPLSIRNWFSEALETAGSSVQELMSTPTGQEFMTAISSGYDVYKNFEKNNKAFVTQVFENLGTGTDLMAVFSPRVDLVNLDRKADALARAAKGAALKSKHTKEKQALINMFEPESLGTRDLESKRGPLGTYVWEPNEFEDTMIEVVYTIPGIKPYGGIRENFRIMQDHVKSQATVLERYIKSQNRAIDVDELVSEYNSSLASFTGSDVYKLASKQAQDQFVQLTDLALQIIKEEGTDLSGVLRARKRLDAAIHKSGTNLDADVATYKVEAARLVRNVLNDHLKRNTKGDEVHHLLDQQHRTLSGLDTLVNKRNREGKNAVQRALGLVKQETGVSLSKTALGIIGTATAALNPAVAATVAGSIGVGYLGRTINRHGKAATLKAFAELVAATNKAIKMANNPTTIEALEMDRLILVDMMNEIRQFEESEEDE